MTNVTDKNTTTTDFKETSAPQQDSSSDLINSGYFTYIIPRDIDC